jgi:hypothetical protein
MEILLNGAPFLAARDLTRHERSMGDKEERRAEAYDGVSGDSGSQWSRRPGWLLRARLPP